MLNSLKTEGDEQIGVNIIKRACEEPLRQITANAGHEGAILTEKVRANQDHNYGFNAATGQYEDLVKSGVVDPTKVTRSALQNAASISALMLTTEARVRPKPFAKDELSIESRWKTAVNGLNRRSSWSTTVKAIRFIFMPARRLRGLCWRPRTRPRLPCTRHSLRC